MSLLTVAEALEMHRQLIDEFGGTHGLRDRALLEAVIFCPQNGYYDDLIHEAAALMEFLGTNRAFLDGNKRICLAATDTFLRINGFFLELETLAAHKFITESIAKRGFRVRQNPRADWSSRSTSRTGLPKTHPINIIPRLKM
jgi:death on curing protein